MQYLKGCGSKVLISQLQRTMFTSKIAQDSIGLSELEIAVLKQRKLPEYLQHYNIHMTRDLHCKLTTNYGYRFCFQRNMVHNVVLL